MITEDLPTLAVKNSHSVYRVSVRESVGQWLWHSWWDHTECPSSNPVMNSFIVHLFTVNRYEKMEIKKEEARNSSLKREFSVLLGTGFVEHTTPPVPMQKPN